MSRPLLLGHRGARASASVAENTFPAFDLALEHGCDGFEFDVRLTACGRAVICHNSEVEGITVSNATVNDLQHLPCLQDVLARYSELAFMDIELKVPGLESQVLVTLGEHTPERGFVVSSFIPDVLTDLRTRSGEVPLGLICDRPKELDLWRELPIGYVIPHYSLITRQLVREAHEADKTLFAWTVNDSESMRRLADWGVDGIVSDETELLARAFA